jgi:integrase
MATVREIIWLYLGHLAHRRNADDFSAQGYDGIERELERFAAQFGDLDVSECRKHDLTEWLEANPQWRSAWTRKRIIETIVRPFTWAADEELIAASPYRVPRMRRGSPRRPATVAEYVALMRGGSRELRRALFFLRRTGARTKEMRDLLWVEVDFERGVIVQVRHKTERQTAQPLPRIIGLDRATLRFLRNLHRCVIGEHVFTNCDGGPWDRHTFARHMHRWADRLGLAPSAAHLSPYCFRHTYGTRAIEAGLGERQLADQMGHATTAMVAYYAQTAGKVEYLRRVAEEALRRKRK